LVHKERREKEGRREIKGILQLRKGQQAPLARKDQLAQQAPLVQQEHEVLTD
jgi:hypothetical protein